MKSLALLAALAAVSAFGAATETETFPWKDCPDNVKGYAIQDFLELVEKNDFVAYSLQPGKFSGVCSRLDAAAMEKDLVLEEAARADRENARRIAEAKRKAGGAAALGGTVYPLSRRTPVETTVNAVVMTGIVPTVGTSYSGGLENVFRFLEGWRGHNCNFNGSILCMWDSEESNAPWPGVDVVYGPPNRNWGYSRMEPPGIPNLFVVRETEWSRVAWGDVDWDAAEWE